ncbi:MAG TPA: DF family (seleno)protein [Candidatus Hypogeohydataceae bacterium YC41]
MKRPKIQLLHTKSCHSYKEALVEIRRALKELGLRAEVEVTMVNSQEKAQAYKFLGSPTIKIDGIDLEPELEATGNFSLSACRTYLHEGSLYHYPPKEMVLKALESVRI